MPHNSIAILGIPIDNLNMDETIEHIFAMVDAYDLDKRPRQVATVNVDFVVNTLTWRLQQVRHPELLDILRRADLVTPDGMPIVWGSKLLGVPLKERVTGSDLVPRLAKEAAERQKSIYFLGGRNDVGQQAADLLKNRYPKLKVAGTDAPFVNIESEALRGAEEEDQVIIERINRSGADILLIGFGNPKQEIWFDRNRNRLRVPVSIGIGGTYEFIIGSVSRAPLWMQKTGLEWVYRITQDPWRLWKRYFVGFFKFGLMMLPAVLYYRFKRMLYNLYHKKASIPADTVFRVGETSVADLKLINVPNTLDAAVVKTVRDEFEKMVSHYSNTVLDFSQTDFIDSSGIGLLVRLRRKAANVQKELFIIGIKSSTRRFLKLSRILDLFKDRTFNTLNEVTAFIKEKSDLPSFYHFSVVRTEDVILHLIGVLDAAQMAALDVGAVIKKIGNKDCIFNLMDLTFIDSSGIMFFLKIQKHVAKQEKVCLLFGMQDNVKQMFRITKLDRLFKVTRDMLSAEKVLEEARNR